MKTYRKKTDKNKSNDLSRSPGRESCALCMMPVCGFVFSYLFHKRLARACICRFRASFFVCLAVRFQPSAIIQSMGMALQLHVHGYAAFSSYPNC